MLDLDIACDLPSVNQELVNSLNFAWEWSFKCYENMLLSEL